MFSGSLFKKTVKDNWKFWFIVMLALVVMLSMLMFAAYNFANNPDLVNLPDADEFSGGMILQTFYSMFALLLPMIYIVLTGNKLLAVQVDKGSLACVMSKPIKRNDVSLTQAAFLIGSIVAMFSIVTVVGLGMIAATGLSIDIGMFLLLNLGIVCFHLAISGISFLASCIFNLSSNSLAVGVGIPVMFFVFNILAGFSSLMEIMGYFKYLTLNSLYSVTDIMASSSNVIWQFLVLFGVAVGCYTAGVLYFKKKDLPL